MKVLRNKRQKVDFKGCSYINIDIEIDGQIIKDLHTLIDTGFTQNKYGAGLQLPESYMNYSPPVIASTKMKLANDQYTSVGIIGGIRLLKFGDFVLQNPINMRAVCLGDLSYAIGSMFLQKCISTFDGPNGVLRIELCQ